MGNIAIYFGSLAAFGLFAAIILAVFFGKRKLAGDIALTSLGIIVAVPVVLWVDRNVWWISAIAGISGAVLGGIYLWHRYCGWLETLVGKDLNGNKQIGV